jgi:hypothetical protein
VTWQTFYMSKCRRRPLINSVAGILNNINIFLYVSMYTGDHSILISVFFTKTGLDFWLELSGSKLSRVKPWFQVDFLSRNSTW